MHCCDQAARTIASGSDGGAVEACEFFLSGGPSPFDETSEPDTGSCWPGFAYFSYLLLNAEELVRTCKSQHLIV